MRVSKNRKYDTKTQVVYNASNHKNYTIEEVSREIEKVREVLKDMGFEVGEVISVHFNNRMTNTCGRCTKTAMGFRIELSSFYVSTASDEAIRNTIAHEVVHTVKNCLNHGPNFKYVGGRLYPFGYTITTLNRDGQYKQARREAAAQKPYWLIKCPKCGYRCTFKRKTKTISYVANNRYNKDIPCPDCGDKHLQVFHVEDGMETRHFEITL